MPREHCERALAKRDAARAERDRLARDLEAIRRERDRIRAELFFAQERIRDLEPLHRSVDAARRALADRLAVVENELRRADAKPQAAEGFSETLRRALAASETRLRELECEREAANALVQRLVAAETELRTLREALARANDRIAALERLLAQGDTLNPLEASLRQPMRSGGACSRV